ncbi:toll-like receptor 7 [Clavelina lepadiformis]|uniref:toll-like receptor 7 n=1 Tax=Clavelina lepadiformis TaxID=159417 RepID=UPI0040433791
MRCLIAFVFTGVFITCCSTKNQFDPCETGPRIRGGSVSDLVSSFSNYLETFSGRSLLDRDYFVVNCFEKGLTSVPQMLARDVEVLDLSYNLLRWISAKDFLRYSKLTFLNLAGNCDALGSSSSHPFCVGDFYIEPGALRHLTNLTVLNVAGNYLREFPQQLPPSILAMDISWTDLNDVSLQLQHMHKLETLRAVGNCLILVNAHRCVRNFTITQRPSAALKNLLLEMNSWNEIPRALLSHELKDFSFGFNPVSRLRKDDFANATKLQKIEAPYMGSMASTRRLVVEDGVFDPLTYLQSLNLSGNLILFLPKNVFSHNHNLEILDISYNSLTKAIIEPKFLTNLINLRSLDLSFNVANIPSIISVDLLRLGEVFSTLLSLEELFLGTANIPVTGHSAFSLQFHKIDSQSFASLSNLSQLSTIDISYCNVHHISFDAWSGLRHLSSFRASHNTLTFDRNTVNGIRSAKQGRVFGYQLLHSPNSMKIQQYRTKQINSAKNAFGLRSGDSNVLDLSNNRIVTFFAEPEPLLARTKMLDLSYNRIRVIRESDLRHLKHLSAIDLSNNPLVRVDSFTFSTFSNLKEIRLVGEFVQLANLSFLCHFNVSSKVALRWKIPVLQSELANWLDDEKCFVRSVTSLSIAQNPLRYRVHVGQEAYLSIFPDVKRLDLSYCKLCSPIPNIWFSGLHHLDSLDLSFNNLVQFPSTALHSLMNLSALNLNFNNIIELKGNISFLSHLRVFAISNNKINFIQTGFFSRLRLTKLDLSFNYISRLDPSILNESMLKSLSYLDIRWNELDCSCYIWDKFYLWYISDESNSTELPGFLPECTTDIDEYFGGCVACHSPLNLRGRPVSRYGFNTSCDLEKHFAQMLAFTIFFVMFLFCGTIGYSKWFKRLIFRKVNEYFRVQSLKPDDAFSRKQTRNYQRAFVFFDHNNNELGDWVDNKLVPGMINGNPSVELLLAGRDIGVGSSSTENLLQLVTSSRKTIMIFSGNFCKTPVCRFILTALQELQYSAGKNQLILVEWHGEEAARVPELIQRTFNRKYYNFLRFNQTNDDEAMFFETLRTAFASSTILDD